MFSNIRRRITSVVVIAMLAAAMPIAAAPASAGVIGADLRAVSFVSATTGFAAAANGVILKTTDGGASWAQVRAADTYSFRGIDFWSATNGVAVDYAGKVAKTTNGGASWVNVDFTPNPDMDPPASSLSHHDVAADRGGTNAIVAAGDDAPSDDDWIGGTGMRTTGTLEYWRNPSYGTRPHLYWNGGSLEYDPAGKGEFLDVEYASASVVWASGIDYWTLDGVNPEKYPLFKSDDGGATYTKVTGFGTNDLRLEGVAFSGTSAGIVVGRVVSGSRVVYRTTNGGTSWVAATTLPGTAVLNAVDMSSATHGWAVGDDGAILRTTDGGDTWSACTIAGGNAFPLYDVTFVPGTTTGWAVGAAGTILLTTDGVNWSAPSGPANNAPVAVADSYATAVNTPKVVAAPGVLTNDSDTDGPSAITAIKVSNPSHGTVTLNSNGSFTYTPTSGWSGVDSFTYKANDGAADSAVVAVTITVNSTPPPVVMMNVYRFYNFRLGTHFYTADEAERNYVQATLSGTYAFEGVGYSLNPAANGTPLYRFYRPSTGTHFYTADEAEMQRVRSTMAGTYTFEGPAYNVSADSAGGSKKAVYRFYNVRNGTHFYTADPAEKAYVEANLSGTYSYDGPAFYLGQ